MAKVSNTLSKRRLEDMEYAAFRLGLKPRFSLGKPDATTQWLIERGYLVQHANGELEMTPEGGKAFIRHYEAQAKKFPGYGIPRRAQEYIETIKRAFALP